ncbi:MAG: hypothetical protein HKL85_13090 [Acidimicrobiaceae bacterium]|nr:hypothetical protein [Acidimicrobiaceae bacterium]
MRAILGTMLDGDLRALAVRGMTGPVGATHWVGFTFEDLSRHCCIIGGTGTGKTVTQMRLVSTFMRLSQANPGEPTIRIIFVDAKGLADENRDQFGQLARARGYRNIRYWPEQPLCGFDGKREQLRERLSGLFNGGESPFHHAEAVTMLDLALGAGSPPRRLAELIERVRPGVTAALYELEGTERSLMLKAEASSFTNSQWNSVYLRLRALVATVGDRFDSCSDAWSLRDVDAAWISVPGTSSPQTAGDVASWILSMIGELAASPDNRRTIICLDEFSAVGQDQRASQFAAGLVERTRSAGIAIVIGAQTVASLGEAADRLLQTCGTVISHRTPLPDSIVELAGTVQVWEDSQTVDALGVRVATSGRIQQQYRTPPDLIRSLPIGEVVVVRAGRWAQVAISTPSNS